MALASIDIEQYVKWLQTSLLPKETLPVHDAEADVAYINFHNPAKS